MSCKIKLFPKSYRNLLSVLNESSNAVYNQKNVSKIIYSNREFNVNEVIIHSHKNHLNEDVSKLAKTLPTDDVLEYIKNHDNIWNIDNIAAHYISSQKVAAYIMFYEYQSDEDVERNERLKTTLNKLGYYLAAEEYINDELHMLQYEPNFSEDIVNDLTKVYHITAQFYKDEILKNGLICRSDTSDFNYPERIYFFTEYDETAMINHIRRSKALRINSTDNPIATIFEVHPPKDVVFYLDVRAIDPNGNLRTTCVYTYSDIEPKYIHKATDIEVKRRNISFSKAQY